MNLLLIKLNGSRYVIEKEGTGLAKEIVRLEGESKDDFVRRAKKIFKEVCFRYKELHGKEI